MSDMTQNESHTAISKESSAPCPQCQHEFACDIAQGRDKCWCMNYPAVLPVIETAKCLCPDCLSQAISDLREKVQQSS